MSELKQQLRKMAQRDDMARCELVEQKKADEASVASLTDKLKTAQKEKMDLEGTLDKASVNAIVHCESKKQDT